jgi:hypothetical protein
MMGILPLPKAIRNSEIKSPTEEMRFKLSVVGSHIQNNVGFDKIRVTVPALPMVFVKLSRYLVAGVKPSSPIIASFCSKATRNATP